MVNETADQIVQIMNNLIDEIILGRRYRLRFLNRIKWLKEGFETRNISKKEYDTFLKNYLRGQTEKYWLDYYNNYLSELFNRLEYANDKLLEMYTEKKITSVSVSLPGQPKKIIEPEKRAKAEEIILPGMVMLDKKTRENYLKELNLEEEYVKEVINRRKKKQVVVVEKEYTLYESNKYGQISNKVFENLTISLTKKYPDLFEKLYRDLKRSGIKVLSKTYISMALLSASIAFVLITLATALFFRSESLFFQLVRGFMIGIFATIGTLAFFYFYPSSVASEKEKAIKSDLPFAIVHMSAVAGSGAQPISMFTTILSSEGYSGIRDEIKKIVNYVNIFGYDLSTALKIVSRSTPSVRFKDFLEGVVTTTESGGSLKEFLVAVADDAMVTYKLERNKWSESVSTYADIYTALLIAAPLLFMVTLRIIDSLGAGELVPTIALIGVFLGIPALNGAFYLFITLMQPK